MWAIIGSSGFESFDEFKILENTATRKHHLVCAQMACIVLRSKIQKHYFYVEPVSMKICCQIKSIIKPIFMP